MGFSKVKNQLWICDNKGFVHILAADTLKLIEPEEGAAPLKTKYALPPKPATTWVAPKGPKTRFGPHRLYRLRFGPHRLYRTPMAKAVLFGRNSSFEF